MILCQCEKDGWDGGNLNGIHNFFCRQLISSNLKFILNNMFKYIPDKINKVTLYKIASF